MNAEQQLKKVLFYLASKLSSAEVDEVIKILDSDADEEPDTKPDPIAEDAARKAMFPHYDRLKPGTRAGVCPPTVRTLADRSR